MKELGTLLNGEDGKLTVEVQASNADMQDLMNLMEGLTVDIEQGINIGEDTIQIAKELSSEESFYHPKMVDGGVINMDVNSAQGSVLDAKGQNLSINALEQGNKLVEFSNTLNNQLMMGQYQALYDFAKTFATNSSEALQGTQEAMGEDFNKTSEDFENGGDSSQTVEAGDEAPKTLGLSALQKMGLDLFGTIQTVQEAGKESEKIAEQTQKRVEEFKAEQNSLVNDVKATQDAKAQEVQQKAASGDVEGANNEGKAAEQATTQEISEADAKTAEVNKAVETNNEEGISINELLDTFLDTNKDYGKLNREAQLTMTSTIATGATAISFGITSTVIGASLISAGTPLLFSPFTFLAGMAMITMGTKFAVLGGGLMTAGTGLVVTGGFGIAATVETGETVEETGETVSEAIEEVDQIQGNESEDDDKTQAEKEREALEAKGLSELEIAAYFGGKSVQYSALTEASIINIKQAALEVLIDKITSDIIAKQTVKATERDNETIARLEARKVEAQRVKEEEEQKVRDYVNDLVARAEDGDKMALEILRGIMENTSALTDAIKRKVDAVFSEADQARIDQLTERIAVNKHKT